MSYKFDFKSSDVAGQFCEAQAQLTVLAGERDAAQQMVGRLVAERDTARYETASLRATMSTGESQLRSQLAILTTQRDSLISQIATLKAQQADYDTRLRGDLVKFGVRAEAITFPTGKPTRETQTQAKEKSAWRSGADLTALVLEHNAITGYRPPQPQT